MKYKGRSMFYCWFLH